MTKSLVGKSKHTPGQWKTRAISLYKGHTGPEVFITNFEGVKIAEAMQDNRIDTAEAEANGKLIAAAPELLEALIKCRLALTPHVFIDNDAREARNIADEAIAKAEGR